MKTNFALLLLAMLVATHAMGALTWEKTALELHPATGDETAVGHFKYKNTGDRPVRIQNVATSCGCTAASTKQGAIAPGEAGEVTATFHIGNRVGLQEKTLTVTTDDPAQPSTTLQLKVAIPQLLMLQPAFVFWKAGEKPAAKTIAAQPGKGVSIKKLTVTSSNPAFSTKVDSTANGFLIHVTPRATDQMESTLLTINPNLPAAPARTFTATARIVAPSPQRSTAASPPPVAAAIDACDLLSKAEIEAVQGEPVRETKPSAGAGADGVAQCYFLLTTPSNSISLSVVQKAAGAATKDPRTFWQEMFHGAKAGRAEEEEGEKEEERSAPESVPDLGEEAFWIASRVGGQLMVLKENSYFVLSLGGAGDEATRRKKSTEFARLILSRL